MPQAGAHRGRWQAVRCEQFQESPSGAGDDGLAAIEDEAHAGEVPATRCDFVGVFVDQSIGEVGRPGDGGAMGGDPVQPGQRAAQDSLGGCMYLCAAG